MFHALHAATLAVFAFCQTAFATPASPVLDQLRDMEIVLGATVAEMQDLQAENKLGNFEIQDLMSSLRSQMQPLVQVVSAQPAALNALCNNEVIEGVFNILDDRLSQQPIGQVTAASRRTLVQGLVGLHRSLDDAASVAESC